MLARAAASTGCPFVQVKASGGIRSASDALAMLDAGATRLGVSAGVAITAEARRLVEADPENRSQSLASDGSEVKADSSKSY